MPGAPGNPGFPFNPGGPIGPGSPIRPLIPSGPGQPGIPLSPLIPVKHKKLLNKFCDNFQWGSHYFQNPSNQECTHLLYIENGIVVRVGAKCLFALQQQVVSCNNVAQGRQHSLWNG